MELLRPMHRSLHRAAFAPYVLRIRQTSLQTATVALDRLQGLVAQLESKHMEAEFVAGLQAGTSALETVQRTLSVSSISSLLSRTDEALENQEAVNDMLIGTGLYGAQDDALIEEELAALGAETEAMESPGSVVDTAQQEPGAAAAAAAATAAAEPESGAATAHAVAAAMPDVPSHDVQVATATTTKQQQADAHHAREAVPA